MHVSHMIAPKTSGVNLGFLKSFAVNAVDGDSRSVFARMVYSSQLNCQLVGKCTVNQDKVSFPSIMCRNKQLLDEVEHDIVNYQNLVSVLSA